MVADGRVAFIQPDRPSPSNMVVHGFNHSGVDYEVRVRQIDGQPFAALFIASTDHGRPLLPFPDDLPAKTSARSLRTGYIAVAEWLVKTGRWPDAETRSLYAAEGLKALAA